MFSDFTSKHNGIMRTDLPLCPKQTKMDKSIFFKFSHQTSYIRQAKGLENGISWETENKQGEHLSPITTSDYFLEGISRLCVRRQNHAESVGFHKVER